MKRVRMQGYPGRPKTPPGAVACIRPYRWGNRHLVGKPCKVPACSGAVHTLDEAIEMYARLLRSTPGLLALARVDLAGRDLACWCKLDAKCHVDVLLRVAAGGDP